MDLFSLIALIGAFVLVVVSSGIALLGAPHRRRKQLPAEPPALHLPPEEAEEAEEDAAQAEAPAGTVPTAPAQSAPAGQAAQQEVPEAPARELETPTEPRTRLARLRARLAKSNSAMGRGLLALLSRDTLDEQTWEEIEDTLIMADLGVGPTTELVDTLRERVAVLGTREPAVVREMLREELIALVDPAFDRALSVERSDEEPAVVLVVGVNGAGKTTTVGKIARVLVAEGRSVLLGAADTFRAAAAEQLTTWGDRVGVETVRGAEGADPASVAFSAVERGIADSTDVVLIDTAGRLQNKRDLMDELGKVKRVAARPLGPDHQGLDEVLLVLDATTGQNGLQQARVFSEAVDITGIVLTKLDGTAKGGIVVAVQRELGVPVKLIGLGEGADDLAPFDAAGFVDALLAD